MPAFEWRGIYKAICAAIVVGLESLELTGLLAIGTCHGLTGCIAREAVKAAIHQIGLVPVLRRQKLDVQSCFACQCFRHGLVEPNGNLDGIPQTCYHNAAIEVVVIVTQAHFNLLRLFVHGSIGGLGHKVPLLGSLVKSDGATLHGANAVMDDFNAGVLFVIKATIEVVAIDQNIDALAFEILKVVEYKVLLGLLLLFAATGCEQEERGE